MRSRIENLGRTGLGPVGTSSVNLTPTEQSTASKDEPPRQPKGSSLNKMPGKYLCSLP